MFPLAPYTSSRGIIWTVSIRGNIPSIYVAHILGSELLNPQGSGLSVNGFFGIEQRTAEIEGCQGHLSLRHLRHCGGARKAIGSNARHEKGFSMGSLHLKWWSLRLWPKLPNANLQSYQDPVGLELFWIIGRPSTERNSCCRYTRQS